MQRRITLLTALLVEFGTVIPANSVDSGALDLDGEFSRGPTLIKFFSPKCPHCRSMQQDWKELANVDIAGTKLVDVDCTVTRSVCERFDVTQLPTILFVKNGLMYKYTGNRSTADMRSFATSKYTSVDGSPIPSKDGPSIAERGLSATIGSMITGLVSDVVAIVKFSPLGVLTIFLFGLTIGAILAFMLSSLSDDQRLQQRVLELVAAYEKNVENKKTE